MAPSSVNGGASTNLGLKILWVQGKGGWTDPGSGPGRPAWADRPRPISARRGRPFAPVGPHVFMHFAPPFAIFWRCHPHVQDVGPLCMNSGLLCFNPRGCSFVTLWSLPPLEVISSSSWTRQDSIIVLLWTCCESDLYVHVFLHKHNTFKCRHTDELVIWLVCLVAG
jgi:hypothetical protein